MPTLSATRQSYLDAEDYTDCYCVRIVRADGEVLRFTSYVRDLVMSTQWDPDTSTESGLSPNVTYKANTGYDMTALSANATLAVDNVDVMGIYEASGVTRDDLESGAYDGAEVYIFLTDYENPVEDEHPLKRAIYGITSMRDDGFHIEFRGLTQYLQQQVGRRVTILSDRTLEEEHVPLSADDWQASTAYSNVRADRDWKDADVVKPTTPNGFWFYLSDAGTTDGSEPSWPTSDGATVTDGTAEWTAFQAYKYDATVTSVTDNSTFFATALNGFPDGWFTYGVITWNSGDNVNKSVECIKFTNGGSPVVNSKIELFLDAYFDIAVNDTFTITVGYDRTLTQCKDKFDNVVNFGGFPHLPGPRTAGRFGGQ